MLHCHLFKNQICQEDEMTVSQRNRIERRECEEMAKYMWRLSNRRQGQRNWIPDTDGLEKAAGEVSGTSSVVI